MKVRNKQTGVVATVGVDMSAETWAILRSVTYDTIVDDPILGQQEVVINVWEIVSETPVPPIEEAAQKVEKPKKSPGRPRTKEVKK